MTYVAVQAYGDGDESESIVESGTPSVAQPTNLIASIAESNLVIEFDYLAPIGDVKEGFLIYIGLSATPDWENALDVENNNSDDNYPTEHFSITSPSINSDLTYIAVRTYGGGLTADSEVFPLYIDRTKIKNISLLLKKFGSDSEYTCSVSVYKANDQGTPEGAPLGTATRSASDITFESYYNFIFDPVIKTDETKLVITFSQSSSDSNNFVLWMHSQEGEFEDWSISGNISLGQDQTENLDFLDPLDYEWETSQSIKRCVRVYGEFNEITFDNEAGYLKIPGALEKSEVFSNRQELFDGFKKNISIDGDRVTLSGGGRRILFYDTNDPNAKWIGTNRGLAPEVLCYDISSAHNGNDNAYNCFLVAGTTEGLFYSENSGGDWKSIEHNSVKDKSCSVVVFEPGSRSFYIVVEDSGVFNIYKFNSISDAPILHSSGTTRINHLYYSEYLSTLIIGTDDGIILNSNHYLSGLKVNRVRSINENVIAVCCDTEAVHFNTNTFQSETINETSLFAPIYDIASFSRNGRFYLASEKGLYISREDNGDISLVQSWMGHDPSESPYLINANRTKTLEIKEDLENQILYVAQDTGVISTSTGSMFSSLASNLHPDTDVIEIKINPVDERIIHILSKTTKGKYPFFTFLIDQSGDMNSGSQYVMMESVAQRINDSYPDSRFEIVTFSTMEKDSASQTGERKGASNITEGFVSWRPSLISGLSTNRHHRTPFYEALWATLVGIYKEGVYWHYDDKDQKKYKFEDIHNELFSNSSRILILFTSGRDTNSTKTIEQILNGDAKFPGIKSMDLKLYIVAMGEQADMKTLSQLDIPDHELIHLRDENIDDYNRFSDYIVNKEKHRYRDGVYRKSFRKDYLVHFTSIDTDFSSPRDTEIELRYRVSDNFYDLGGFSKYIALSAGGTSSISVNKSGKYIEIEYKLKSYSIHSSPSIKTISFNYRDPSKSSLVLNAASRTEANPMHQIQLTANMSMDFHDYGHRHFLDQPSEAAPIICDADINNTKSFHDSLFENIGIDRRSIIDIRKMETTISEDFMIYRAVNGPWDYSLDVDVYNNGKEVAKSEYYTNPQDGTINFFNPRKTSDSIAVTISTSLDYRLRFTFNNLYRDTVVKLDNAAIQYLDDSPTILFRKALPLTASQVPSDTAAVVRYSSTNPGNNDIIVAGSEAYIHITYVVRQELTAGNKIIVGLGEFTEIPDETFIFKQHEKGGITGKLQSTEPNVANYTLMESTRKGVLFSIKQYGSLDGFIEATISGAPLRKNDIVNIYIGGKPPGGSGYSTLLQRKSETNHVISDGTVGGIRAFVAIAAGDSPGSSDLMRCLPEITYEGARASEMHHVSAPVTPDSSNFNVLVTIVDNHGIVASKATASLILTLIDIKSGARSHLTTATIEPKDGGSKKIPVTIAENGTYQILVKNMNTGYATVTNAIITGSDNRIYFGDLNAKSTFGNGRQSLDFVYKYARDKSGLDFVAVSDATWTMSDPDWNNSKKIADHYNVEGEFVALIGAEWRPRSDNTGYRSIIFKGNNTPQLDKISNQNLVDLYSNLSGYSSLIFTEHPSYSEESLPQFNVNWKDLKDRVNQSLEVGVEIYSEHGNAESFSLSSVNGITPAADEDANSYVVDAIRNGLRFSLLGNSNSNSSRPGLYAGELRRQSTPRSDMDSSCINNRGITGVISNNLSRSSIFEAIKAGKTFATTGARIYMEFRCGSATLGDSVSVETPVFHIRVIPTTDFANVSLMRIEIGGESNNAVQVVATISVSSSLGEQEIVDQTSSPATAYAYFIRVFQEDDHAAWSSPIYITTL